MFLEAQKSALEEDPLYLKFRLVDEEIGITLNDNPNNPVKLFVELIQYLNFSQVDRIIDFVLETYSGP